MEIILNTPTYLVGQNAPALDAPWLPRGTVPLPSPLPEQVTVDHCLLHLLLPLGFSVPSSENGTPPIESATIKEDVAQVAADLAQLQGDLRQEAWKKKKKKW